MLSKVTSQAIHDQPVPSAAARCEVTLKSFNGAPSALPHTRRTDYGSDYNMVSVHDLRTIEIIPALFNVSVWLCSV